MTRLQALDRDTSEANDSYWERRRLRVLWFNWRSWVHPLAGGAEVQIREIAKRWVKWGHDVTVFSGGYKGGREHEVLEGVETIRKGSQFTVYMYAAWNYMRHLKKSDYDVIVDDINGIPFFTPLYVRSPKMAIVHHLVKDIFFRELSWGKALIGYMSEKMIPFVYRKTPIAVDSESTKSDLLAIGMHEGKIRVMHNGVDQEVYRPKPSAKSPHPNVICLGRVMKYKNLDHLLLSFKNILDQLKGKDLKGIRLTIAGKGSYKELEELAERLKISSNVDLLGEVTEKEKVKLLQNAWVYVTTSMREGWGLTAVEAMACGTPVVCYDVEGLRNAVKHMKTGILVPAGDIDALSKAIVRLLKDDQLRAKLAKNASEWSTKQSWDITARELMDIARCAC